jgi:hypothetical protein
MRRLPALVAGLVVALLATSAAGADPAAPFDFGGTGTLKVVPGTPTSTELCNGTGATVTAQLSTEGFASLFAQGATAPALTDPTATIPAGSCSEIKVSVPAGVLPARSYDGTLVAASSAGVARRAVTIAAAAGALAGAVTDITLAARHYPFWQHASLIGGQSIPLGPYAAGTVVVPPRGILAILQSGSHRAYLVVNVPKGTKTLKVRRGFASLPVALSGAVKTGTYKGVVTLGGSNVNVSVAVGDPILFCAVAIAAGILFAVLAALLAQRWFPGWRLRSFRKRLAGKLSTAVSAYTNARGPRSQLPELWIAKKRVKAYAAAIDKAYARYKKQTVLLDPNSDEYKAVCKLVDAANDDAVLLGAKDGLVDSLRKLKRALDRFKPPANERPRFVDAAKKLLDERALGPGDATTLAASAAAYTALLEQWPALRQSLTEYRGWLDEVTKRIPKGDEALLRPAAAILDQIAFELVASDSVEAFDHAGVQAELDRAYQELSQLGWVYHPPALSAKDKAAPAANAIAYVFHMPSPALSSSAAAAPPPAHLFDHAHRAVASKAHSALDDVTGHVARPASYLVVSLLAIATALSAGLPTLYSDTFGSFGNYLTAFGLGGAAGIASKTILDGFASVRKLEP